MKKEMLYHELAKYYDFIYYWKDYKKDADKIRKLVLKYKKSDGRKLLDVACGTGQHIKYLKSSFSCTGLDISKDMLKIAKKKLKGVVFKQGNMQNFALHKKFDAIICLFSSIGYVKTLSNFKKTIQNFGKHMEKGGLVIIEAWIPKSDFRQGRINLNAFNRRNIKIARLVTSKIKGDISVLYEHYLIGEKDKGIRYYKTSHELGFFKVSAILNLMEESGFKSKFLRQGFIKNRGIYIGVKS